jgi:hypothetical protein
MSDDALKVEHGSLPRLQRLRQEGRIKAEWGARPQPILAEEMRVHVEMEEEEGPPGRDVA